MKKYQALVTSLVCLLAVGAITTFAQWSPPTGAPPSGNVPAPINVGTAGQIKKSGLGLDLTGTLSAIGAGNALNIKGGNVVMTNSRIISDANTGAQNPSWTPPSGIFSNVFSFDTDSPISAYGMLSSASVYATTDLYSGNLASSAAGVPALRQLCGQSTDGKVVLCNDAASGGPGPSGGTAKAPTITFANFKLNGSPITPNTGIADMYLINDAQHYKHSLAFTFSVANASTCWIAAADMQGFVLGSNLNQGASFSNDFSGTKGWTVICNNSTTNATVGKTVYVSSAPEIGPASIELYTSSSDDSLSTDGPYGSGLRWRQNELPIRVDLKINSSNEATTYCRKRFSAFAHYVGPHPIYGKMHYPNPWTGNVEPDKWTTWTAVDNLPHSQYLKCSNFFDLSCDHASEGARVIDLQVECYNGQNGQTEDNPVFQDKQIEWLNPN